MIYSMVPFPETLSDS